ncbi:MAG: hypothetical protein E6Q88_06990 [Lysobacteraceae bacterium]|nr:MAG: hypothetical protein E6Q88_06990 [Xanthomonadaceae bacterium]
MRQALWFLISAAFFVSIAGMCVSTLLWSRRVRESIISLWVTLGGKAERPDLKAQALMLYATLLNVFMLTADGRVSKLKTLRISYVSVAILAIGLYLFMARTGTDTTQIKIAAALATALFSLPLHWLFEYRFSKFFHRTFVDNQSRGPLRASALGLIGGASAILRFLPTIIVLMLPAFLLFAYENSILARAWVGKAWFGEEWSFLEGKDNLDVALLAASTPSLFNGFGVLAAVSISEENPNLVETTMFLLSICTSATIVFLLLLSASVAHSRIGLALSAKACEFIASRDPRLVFMASTTLFAIATGLMQAFTFFPMPER